MYSSEITGAREPEGVWIVSILPRGFCSSEVAVNNDLCFMGAWSLWEAAQGIH